MHEKLYIHHNLKSPDLKNEMDFQIIENESESDNIIEE